MLVANDGSWACALVHKCATKSLEVALSPLATHVGTRGDTFTTRQAQVHFAVCRDPYERAKSIYYQLFMNPTARQEIKAQMADAGYAWNNVDEAIEFIEQSTIDIPLFRTQSYYDQNGVIDVWVPLNDLQAGVEAIVGPVNIPDLNESPETGINIVGRAKQVVDRYYADDMRFLGNG